MAQEQKHRRHPQKRRVRGQPLRQTRPETMTWLTAQIQKTKTQNSQIEKKEDNKQTNNAWLLYAVLSVIFASLTTILGKIGITNIESNLGTAIRTSVVLIMSWIVVFVTHSQMNMKSIPKKEYLFIMLSGLATGGSWLCFYHALQSGPASLVTPIDKLSILFTVLFSYLIFHEKLSKKSLLGLILIVFGTLIMLL